MLVGQSVPPSGYQNHIPRLFDGVFMEGMQDNM